MEHPEIFLIHVSSSGNEDRLSEFVWHVPLFLPARSCRSSSTLHMEINCTLPQFLQIHFSSPNTSLQLNWGKIWELFYCKMFFFLQLITLGVVFSIIFLAVYYFFIVCFRFTNTNCLVQQPGICIFLLPLKSYSR